MHIPATSAKLIAVTMIASALSGCGDTSNSQNSRIALLKLRLASAITGYQNAENAFGPSTNSEDFVRNGHWLDRMAAEYRKVEAIRKELALLKGPDLSELTTEMAQRFRTHLATLKSDIEYVGAINELEIAKIWLDI